MDILSNTEAFLRPMRHIARQAGDRIMEVYNNISSSDFTQVQTKADNSPLTKADIASHECIVSGLTAQFPDIPVLSEESVAVPYAEREQWETFFLVDPLDGTKEFIKRNGEFTVNIALIRNGCPVMGVVYAPALNTMWYAAEGAGSFKECADGSMRLLTAPRVESLEKLSIVGSRSHPSPAMAGLLKHLPEYDILPMGSSLKLCVVAEGTAHLYPRLGLTSEWDTAAAQCVVEQAGGRVLQLDGCPVRYNKQDILNPFFMVTGSMEQSLEDRLMELTRSSVNSVSME